MPIHAFAEQIRDLVSRDEVALAIELLHEMLKNSPKLDDAIMQSARHHDILRQIRLGIVDDHQASLTKNQIRTGILDLLRELETGEHSGVFPILLSTQEANQEFDRIVRKISTNRGIGTSEILIGKTAEDLDARELGRFFSRARTQRRFAEDQLDMEPLSVHERLLQLSLAENGHLYKGTFFCLGQTNQIESINHTAAESKFAIFKGTTRSNFLVLEEVRGNLIQQYEKMLLLLQQHIPLRRDVHKSEDSYSIPFVAFKELVANAFIHRSYDPEIRSTIQVELFDDRLEIKSPGLFPEPLDLQNIEMSVVINPVIAAIFFLCGHIEKSGTGINRATEALEQQNMRPPELYQDVKQRFSKMTIFR